MCQNLSRTFFLDPVAPGRYAFRMKAEDFESLLRARLAELEARPIGAALRAGLPRDAIRSVLRGHPPTLPRAAAICEALGLELTIGERPPPGSAGAASGLMREAAAALARLAGAAESAADRLSGPEGAPEDARLIEILELATAAGGGTSMEDAPVRGHAAFRRDWLDRNGLDPTQCVVIGVRGESMEPTLVDGCSILVDRARRRRRDDRVFVVAAPDGLVVKRLRKRGESWHLASDHAAWPETPWPDDAELVGEVVWSARTL